MRIIIEDEELQATVAVIGEGDSRVVVVQRGDATVTVPLAMVEQAVLASNPDNRMKTITITKCADCPHWRSAPTSRCIWDMLNPMDIVFAVAVAEIDARCPLPNNEVKP